MMRTLASCWGLLCALLLLPGAARAERPISFREALETAAEANLDIAAAQFSVEQAEASVLGARGIFDPSWSSTLSWFRTRDPGYEPSLDVATENDNLGWTLDTNVGGSTATGTSWSIGGDYSASEFLTRSVGACAFCPFEFEQSFRNANLDLSIGQELLRGILMKYNTQSITSAQNGLSIAEIQLERTRQDTLAGAAAAYWGFHYQHALMRLAEDNVEVAREALRVVRLKVEAGELAPVEETRQQADLVQKQADLIAARQAARQAADELLLLLGQPPGQDLLPATDPGQVPDLAIDSQRAIEVALAQNADLSVARAELDAAQLDLEVARHGLLPSLSANLSSTVRAQGATFSETAELLSEDFNSPTLTASGVLVVPLGNRAARGSRDGALASMHAQDVALQKLEAQVRSQVAQQVMELNSAARRVDLADANLRLAEQTLQAEEALAEAGRSIHKDVLEARQAAESARVEAAKARTDYRLAQVELLRLQGQLDKDLP